MERIELRNPVNSGVLLYVLFDPAVTGPDFGRVETANTAAETPEPKPESSWMQEALRELNRINYEAREEGLPIPSQQTKTNARHVLRNIGINGLPTPSVYPTEDSEIAIVFASKQPGAGVLILCAPNGTGSCFSSISGQDDSARFAKAKKMHKGFVRDKLYELLDMGI